MSDDTPRVARLKAMLEQLASQSPAVEPEDPKAAETRGDLSPLQAAAAAAPALTLDEYRALTITLPRPTEAQMRAFAVFVSGAHSWYKHLPLYPPGAPFQFFLDPGAGMDLHVRGTRVQAEPRLTRGFHYSWIPTAQYREQFGHLAFSRSAGTTVYTQAPNGTATAVGDDAPSVYDATSQSMRRLPHEVIAAGSAWVSGLVHDEGARPQWLLMCATEQAKAAWPAESGGPQALLRILARCEVISEAQSQYYKEREDDPNRIPDQHGWSMFEQDTELLRLLAPERQRQHDGMVTSMMRMVSLVGGAPACS
ncbi:hypothetical protein RA210_U10572 [Rubrivivax sp. A210]|uniref:hypothetical protein n=1 Tax=Rubrivivax sp. A210 TaxID=2772301 RepID=UPI001919A0CF|nr:hypothetical protein [Rubrivivax sp. A210]CAD5366931.1 hypothetical protein RA210_U10572 [Rubrivivax sp. A210]